jgi:hypothetical protein
MSNTKEIINEINQLLRAYNYLIDEDEDLKIEELPSLVSHLLLLKIFTHEGMNLGIAYQNVDDFCEFAISKVYSNQDQGVEEELDLKALVDEFKVSNLTH